MFTTFAKFRRLRSWRTAPGPQGAVPANDNRPAMLRPGPLRRKSHPLVCHWYLTDGGTRLGCRWQAEAPTQTAAENSDSESAAAGPGRLRRQRDQGRDQKSATLRTSVSRRQAD